jgi:hypothetical protein
MLFRVSAFARVATTTDVPSGCACMLHNYCNNQKEVMSLLSSLSLQRARLLLLAVCFFSVRQNTTVAYVSVSVKHMTILIITTYVTYHYYPSSSPPSTKRSCPTLAKTAQVSFVHSSTLPNETTGNNTNESNLAQAIFSWLPYYL